MNPVDNYDPTWSACVKRLHEAVENFDKCKADVRKATEMLNDAKHQEKRAWIELIDAKEDFDKVNVLPE